jgi:surface antigen
MEVMRRVDVRKNRVITVLVAVLLACFMLVSTFGAFSSIVYAANFNIGDTVEVYNTGTSGLVVRDTACGTQIGGKFDGARGTVLDGPIFCNDYNRWKIRWDDGLIGWSAENWLIKVSSIPDTTAPMVNSLSVSPSSVSLGSSFTISYSVSDTGGSGLNRVELWRANDSGGSPVGWAEVKRTSASGNSYSGSFTDAPSSVESYWYGIHVVDGAGNWNEEKNSNTGGTPGVYGPIWVAIIGPDYKGFPGGYCTWYAAKEFDKVAPSPGVNWHGDAQDWYINASIQGWTATSEPREARVGSIIVWRGNKYGHVAIIRQVSDTKITLDEMNWGDFIDRDNAITVHFGKVTSTGTLSFVGYILPTLTHTVTPTPAPTLSSPSNGATGVSTTPTFTWSAVSGATSYRIMVGTTSSGLPTDPTADTGSGLVINDTPTGTSYTPAPGVLSSGVTYYWEVKARSPTQYGTWSSKWSFTTTTPTTGVPDIRTPAVSIEFGSVTLGNSLGKTTTIYNDGNTPLTINSITRTSGSSELTYISPSAPFSIGAGGSQVVTIRFAPSSEGSKSATFTISSNDPDEASVSFSVSGSGTTAATINDQQKQQEILNMVNNHRGSIPIELVLAIIRQEGDEGAFHIDSYNYNS